LENGKVEIGKKRVEQLTKAFDMHPAIIMFPEYEALEIKRIA
jgi:nicotinate-nucleotide pyrophosphorylase